MKPTNKKPVDIAKPAAAGMASSPPAVRKTGWLRTVLGVMVDPGGMIKRRLGDSGLGVALSVSGLAFALFFLQTGIDRAREGQIGGLAIVTLTLAGLVYGTVGVAITGVAGWAGARLLGGACPIGNAIRAFALAYSPTLIYAALGLLFNLTLGWNTAVAFGVTGVLWALGPMILALREMVGGRTWPATILATGCGFLVLVGWMRVGALV
jgi:hypothetical protein